MDSGEWSVDGDQCCVISDRCKVDLKLLPAFRLYLYALTSLLLALGSLSSALISSFLLEFPAGDTFHRAGGRPQ